MKKNRDFFQDEFPFFDDESNSGTLPDIFDAESERRECGSRRALEALRFVMPFIIMITAAVLVFVIVLIATGNAGVGRSEPAGLSDDVEEWRGAFDSQVLYEKSMESAVSLKIGSGNESKEWSGVIISEDGWIATSKNMINNGAEGRIYVTLSDGREYGVGSLFEGESGAALKIDAEGLRAAEISARGELQCGESVIAVSAGGDVICGTVANVNESLRFSLPYFASSEGAPVFDSEGYLVGIIESCSDGSDSGAVGGADAQDLGKLVDIVENK